MRLLVYARCGKHKSFTYLRCFAEKKSGLPNKSAQYIYHKINTGYKELGAP